MKRRRIAPPFMFPRIPEKPPRIHYITEAVRLAHQFDNTPDYSPNAIQFIEGAEMPAVMMDGLGETAAEAIEWFVFSKAKKSQALVFVKSRFAEMGMMGK